MVVGLELRGSLGMEIWVSEVQTQRPTGARQIMTVRKWFRWPSG